MIYGTNIELLVIKITPKDSPSLFYCTLWFFWWLDVSVSFKRQIIAHGGILGSGITDHHNQSQYQNGLKHVTPTPSCDTVQRTHFDQIWPPLIVNSTASSILHIIMRNFAHTIFQIVKNKMKCSLKWDPKYLWCKSWLHFFMFKGMVKPCSNEMAKTQAMANNEIQGWVAMKWQRRRPR